jgi:23S rRNA (uracil1939-C5)-methyltransferase
MINSVLVSRALGLLAPLASDRVADLFCGLGNFTLPLARCARTVLGLEGSAELVRRAGENARLNGLQDKTRFGVANLFEMDLARWQALEPFDRMLIDPPREGALKVCQALAADTHRLARIVYVSCNPATLARDAAVLVHEGGYVLKSAGAINMFPQTSHVESIAVFEPAQDSEPPGRVGQGG